MEEHDAKIEAAHMTQGGGGLYIPDANPYEEAIPVYTAPTDDSEEDLRALAGGRAMSRSLSSKSKGGEFGTPKFKEMLKLKNFKHKITQAFKVKRKEG